MRYIAVCIVLLASTSYAHKCDTKVVTTVEKIVVKPSNSDRIKSAMRKHTPETEKCNY